MDVCLRFCCEWAVFVWDCLLLFAVLTPDSQEINRFLSQVRDYSGTYTVKLLPCTSAPSLEYTIPPVCNPREPLTFDMDIRFQQVTSPCLSLLYIGENRNASWSFWGNLVSKIRIQDEKENAGSTNWTSTSNLINLIASLFNLILCVTQPGADLWSSSSFKTV